MSKITLTPLSKVIFCASVFCSLSIFSSKAQIFFNNGAQIYTGPTSIIKINGGIENNTSTSAGDIDHNGTMTVTLNSTLPNPGDVTLNGTSVWHGDGRTLVEGDWVNNATFQQDLSYVELYASTVQQQITGTVSTTFHKLKLTGTGTGANRIKLQTLDASVDSLMDVTDRELATDIHTMFILNPDPTIVKNDSLTVGSEGFVSSIVPGVLSRVTNSTSSYNYPVGSSVVLTRYRPVRIAPNNATAATYTVRFINHNSDNDTYLRNLNDGILCQAIDTFYHAIDRPVGNTPADIRLYYRPTSDGSWTGMSHWQTATSIMWHDMATVAPGTNTQGFSTLNRAGWLFANAGDPYLLTKLRPAAPVIVCPTICENGNGTFTILGNGNFVWVTPNGTTINSGQGTNTINVTWGSTGGVVYVVDTTNGSTCASLPDSCVITPMPAPIANFDTSSTGTGTIYQFTDSSQGGTTWFWDFGDGNTSNAVNPQHQYAGAGTYCVTEIVTNAAGCTDTVKICMDVKEAIRIPNVFTPDGNGVNDEFYIPSTGFESFDIQIFNRWGTKIWAANAGEIRWDGHSFSGQMMSDGTYYFVLKAVLKTLHPGVQTDYSTTGYVTLLTKKQ